LLYQTAVNFILHIEVLAVTVISDASKTEKQILQHYDVNKNSVIFMFESVYACLILFSKVINCVIKQHTSPSVGRVCNTNNWLHVCLRYILGLC
jgi:hypothetical protein